MTEQTGSEVRKAVRQTYGEIARGERAGCGTGTGRSASSCCGTSSPSLGLGYSGDDLSALPEGADLGLGCGNPGAIAALQPGETVVDLGSGGGIDCFLAAQQVGATGRVIGVDMTADMIERARGNAERAGAENVEFRLGEIENLPLADGTADVVLSNCVVNLSPDQGRVYREVFRVLKPGGRVAISDMVARAELPESIRKDLALHTGCIAGASTARELERHLVEAGFEDVRIRARNGVEPDNSIPQDPQDAVYSATVEGTKPRNA
jgi:SAM-dependent methyltransferase